MKAPQTQGFHFLGPLHLVKRDQAWNTFWNTQTRKGAVLSPSLTTDERPKVAAVTDDCRCRARSSRSRQPLDDDRLRRRVDQVVEQGAVARDRETVEPPLDEEVVQPFGVAFDDDVGIVDRACVRDAVDK